MYSIPGISLSSKACCHENPLAALLMRIPPSSEHLHCEQTQLLIVSFCCCPWITPVGTSLPSFELGSRCTSQLECVSILIASTLHFPPSLFAPISKSPDLSEVPEEHHDVLSLPPHHPHNCCRPAPRGSTALQPPAHPLLYGTGTHGEILLRISGIQVILALGPLLGEKKPLTTAGGGQCL